MVIDVMGEETSAVCIPCSRDDITETAPWFCLDCKENLCETCSTCHKRNKVSFKHKLVKVTLSSSEELDSPEKCSEHNGKKLKYFCENHDSLCCSRCVIENHRRCKNVLHISKYTTRAKFKMQIMTLEHDLSMLVENAKNIIEYEAGYVRNARIAQEDDNKSGDETRDRLVVRVQNVFAERKRAISETTDKIVAKSEKLQAQTKECLNEIEHVQQIHIHIQAKTFDNEAAKIAAIKSVTSSQEILSNQLKTCFKNLSLETVSSDLNVEADLKTWDTSLSQIPKIQTRMINRNTPPFTESPVVCSTITLTQQKKASCVLRECCVLVSGIILAIDPSAQVIRKFNSVLGHELESIEVESEPWGISHIHPDAIVVSLPFAKKLLFMSYSSRYLNVSFSLTTEAECFSLASFRKDDRNLLMAYSKTQAQFVLVDIDTKKFENVKTPEMITRRNIAPFINHIAVNETGSQVYLSCDKAHKVFACDFDGHILWQFTNDLLHTPRGLVVDAHENILVCSYGTRKILRISNAGKLIHVYISNDKLSEPIALAFNKAFDRCIVCEYDQGYRMKIFKTET